MSKKEQESIIISFTNEYHIPIYAIEVNVSQTTIKNMVDEFKFKYDLKKLEPEHIEHFITMLINNGIKVKQIAKSVEWK